MAARVLLDRVFISEAQAYQLLSLIRTASVLATQGICCPSSLWGPKPDYWDGNWPPLTKEDPLPNKPSMDEITETVRVTIPLQPTTPIVEVAVQQMLFEPPVGTLYITLEMTIGGNGTGEFYKVGYTEQGESKRRSDYQSGNPRKLRNVAKIPAWFVTEAEFKVRFAFAWVQAGGGVEWYRRCPEIDEFIRAWNLIKTGR
jgi:hypothetical protein